MEFKCQISLHEYYWKLSLWTDLIMNYVCDPIYIIKYLFWYIATSLLCLKWEERVLNTNNRFQCLSIVVYC